MQCKLFYRDTDVTINVKGDYDTKHAQFATTSHTNCAAARARITTEPPQLDAIVHSPKSAEMQKHNWSSID